MASHRPKRLEHVLHPWVAFMILPLFAFANAGVSLQGVTLAGLTSLLPLGIMAGLFIGKPLGISLFCWLALKLKWASLPEGTTCKQIMAVGILCGIGFTMSIFIATLAFGSVDPALINWAKLGILIGSVLSAVIGYLILRQRDGDSPRGITFRRRACVALPDIIRERSMSHINYNHLYYFWHVYKEGSVVGAAEALFLTPQRRLPGRSKPWKSACRVSCLSEKEGDWSRVSWASWSSRYADRMFTLSQEMLDIVNYRKESNLLFDVGVADALSKRLVSGVLDAAVVESEQIHLRCFESTHELLLEQLSQHKLDMIISDCRSTRHSRKGYFR